MKKLTTLKQHFKENLDTYTTGAVFLAPGVYWFFVVLKYGTV